MTCQQRLSAWLLGHKSSLRYSSDLGTLSSTSMKTSNRHGCLKIRPLESAEPAISAIKSSILRDALLMSGCLEWQFDFEVDCFLGFDFTLRSFIRSTFDC